MSVFHQNILVGAAGAGGAAEPGLYVDEVFSTFLYDGNGSTQTITNGIDLDNEGGLVWLKKRSGVDNHVLIDTERHDSAQQFLNSNGTSAAGSSSNGITSFNSDGFSISGSLQGTNSPGADQCSWTFRKAPGFFDVVTYTGTGSATTIAHNLGSVPGMIIVKRTDANTLWAVYHRSTGNGNLLKLNENHVAGSTSTWNNTTPTSTHFSVNTQSWINASGGSYVAYVFAHDDQSFGTGGDEAIIKCGTYTGTGTSSSSVGPDINLGFEPQWLLVKNYTTSGGNWIMEDMMRGFNYTKRKSFYANGNFAEFDFTDPGLVPTSTGFRALGDNIQTSKSGSSYVYVAIRRPNKPLEAGTDVFKAIERSGTGASATVSTVGFPLDFLIVKRSDATGYQFVAMDRLRGIPALLQTADGSAENTNTTAGVTALRQDGFELGADGTGSLANTTNRSSSTYINWAFRRGTGFFDVVAYTGSGSATTIAHNLGVAPELIIVKRRETTGNWQVYSSGLTSAAYKLNLDTSTAESILDDWNSTDPTSSVFSLGTAGGVNASGGTYIAYLFATLDGISKVGTYSGTGSNIDVDCSFTAGARFVMIKRTDSSGNWYVWDHARGIVSGNDPYLEIDNNNAQVTGNDYIDPLNSGFTVTSSASADLNASGGTYLFLAIA